MRFTMRSRLSWSLAGLGISSSLVVRLWSPADQFGSCLKPTSANDGSHRLSLDSALVHFALKNSFDIDSGSVNAVGLKFADIDQIFDFDERDLCGGCHHRIEVASSLAIDKIAPFVALPRFADREVDLELALHHVFAVIELSRRCVLAVEGCVTR